MKPTAEITPDLVEATEGYVARTLHTSLRLTPWPATAELPPYLRARYRFMLGDLRGNTALWLLADEPIAPQTLEKHINALAPRWPGAVVVVFRSIPSYVRPRLIQRGIAFVVPGAQLYLPDLGFDFRERTAAPPVQREHLRPSAQLLLLHLIYRDSHQALTASDVVPMLGYTLMSVSRAVAELEAAGLVQASKVGRTKEFRLVAGPGETWVAAQDHLRTPVVRRMVVPAAEWGDARRPLAGLSALAEYTMLAPPAAPVRAIGGTHAREIEAGHKAVHDAWAMVAREDDEEQTEVWSYDPLLLADGAAVDRLSLYLTLRSDTDERVQAALSELLGGMGW